MSPKSARRLKFVLENAPLDWCVMATLTFRTPTKKPKLVLRRFLRRIEPYGMLRGQWCWIMEFQKRGVIHFHVLFARDCFPPFRWTAQRFHQRVGRGGRSRTVLRGPIDRIVTRAWCLAVGDCSEQFLAFQRGGIVEPLEKPDSAGRYFSAYLAKKEQKTLPPGTRDPGRWWFASASSTPLQVSQAELKSWPFPVAYSRVYDRTVLDDHLRNVEPLFNKRERFVFNAQPDLPLPLE